jgi:hypothetical protein
VVAGDHLRGTIEEVGELEIRITPGS